MNDKKCHFIKDLQNAHAFFKLFYINDLKKMSKLIETFPILIFSKVQK